MNPVVRGKRPPEPSKTRTDQDWIMIMLGVFLILVFLVGGYVSLIRTERSPGHKLKGPVKNPKGLSRSMN